jgi:RNA polymerase sigma-70 factor (ECF subfamily)
MPQQRRTDLSASAESDESLLAAIQARDAEALIALYDRYGGSAFGLAYHVLGERGPAEAIVQEAFLNVWRRAGSFQSGHGTPRSWLTSIVHTLAVNRRRERVRQELSDARLDDVRPTPEVSADDAAAAVGRSVEAAAVRAALDALPDEQRAAIELAYLGGLTDDEIAERTGASSDVVQSRLRLGLHGLRAHLFPDEGQATVPETTPGAESP